MATTLPGHLALYVMPDGTPRPAIVTSTQVDQTIANLAVFTEGRSDGPVTGGERLDSINNSGQIPLILIRRAVPFGGAGQVGTWYVVV
jgi:hypothetical protein